MKGFFSKIKKLYYNLFINRLSYIPLKLPVEKITDEFEALIRKKVARKVKEYHIREAAEEDIDSVVHLFDAAWHSTSMPYRPLSKKKLIDKIVHNPDALILIIDIKSVDCGFILLSFKGENNEIGNIPAIGIIPEYHHRGIGTLLGVASWDYFKTRGVKELRAKVYKDNQKSMNFLKGLGFEEDYEQDIGLLQGKIPF